MSLSNKKKYMLVLAVSVLLMSLIPYYSLDVLDAYSEELYISKAFFNNCTFQMEWIHSVELTPWAEVFKVIDGEIILDKTRFKSFGAGVPDSIGTKSEIIDDYVVFSGINKKMPNLIYGISEEAMHVLTISTFNSTYYSLFETLEPDTAIKFKVTKSTFLFRLIRKYFSR